MNCIADAQKQENEQVGIKMIKRDLSRSIGQNRGRSTHHERECEQCNNCQICQLRKYYRDQLKIKPKLEHKFKSPAKQQRTDYSLYDFKDTYTVCRNIPNTRANQCRRLLKSSPIFSDIKNENAKPKVKSQIHIINSVVLHDNGMTGELGKHVRNSGKKTRNIENVKYTKEHDYINRNYKIHNECNSFDKEIDSIILKTKKVTPRMSTKYENDRSTSLKSPNIENQTTPYSHIDMNTNNMFRLKHQDQNVPLHRPFFKTRKNGTSDVGHNSNTIRMKPQTFSFPKEVHTISVTKFLQRNLEEEYRKEVNIDLLKIIHKNQQNSEEIRREFKPKTNYKLLEREVKMTRSKIIQKINHTKQNCLMKSQSKASIKANQNKFFVERYREDINQNALLSDFKSKIKQETSSREKLDQVEGNFVNTNENSFTEGYEEQKVDHKESAANVISSENFQVVEPCSSSLQNGTTHFNSSKKYLKPQKLPGSTKKVAKRDVATYIAPMEHVQETLRRLPDNLRIKNTEIAQINLNDLEQIFKKRGIYEHVKEQCSDNFEQNFNTERIEKYKKEYSKMNESIRENVKLINKYTAAPMNLTGCKKTVCDNQTKQSEKTIHLVIPLKLPMPNMKEHLKNANELDSIEKTDTNKNKIKGCRKRLKDDNIKMDSTNKCTGTKDFSKSKCIKSEKDLLNIETIKNPLAINSNVTDYCNMNEVQYLYQNLHLKQTKLLKSLERSQNNRDCHIDNCSQGDYKTPCFNKNQSSEQEQKDVGNGDVKIIDIAENLKNIKDQQVKDTIVENHKNFKDNLTEKKTVGCSKTKERETERSSTIVDRIKAMLAPVNSDLKRQCSLQNSKPYSTDSKQSNCIKLMSMRKLKHLIVKESESDSVLYRRHQMKHLRHQHFLWKNLKYKEIFQNKPKTLGHPNRTKDLNNTKSDVKPSNKETKIETRYSQNEDEDKFLKCTEYFIQHLKTSRPNFTQLTHNSAMRQLMSRGTTPDTKRASINSGTYKQHLDTRKSGTRKIMDTIDEKIHRLNLTLRKKFLDDKRNMVQGSLDEIKHCHEDGVVTVSREPDEKTTESSNETNDHPVTAGSVLKTKKSSIDLNLDQVFANKNNWITLDMQDEMRIRSDISQLLTQQEK